MKLNPDPSKETQDIYFSKKVNNVSLHPLIFNTTNAVTCSSEKHLALVLDQQLNFNYQTIQSK